MSVDGTRPTPARNLVRAFSLLDVLAAHTDGLTLNELAIETALPEPTTHRLLMVLQDLSVVRSRDNGKWHVGRRLVELGSAYLDSVEIRTEARDLMQGLTADTGESCALGVLDEDRVVYIEKVDSPHPIRMQSAVGRSNPAISSALGRAILAFSPDTTIEHALTARITRPTSNVTISSDALRAELGRCRKRGYSTDMGENEPGLRAAAAPLLDYWSRPLAALSIAGPEQRISSSRLDELGTTIVETARILSNRLGHAASLPDAIDCRQESS